MTTWIILEGPEGKRKVQEGKPYRPKHGEVVIGVESDNEPVQYVQVSEAELLMREIETELKDDGHGLGSWAQYFAKPVAKLLGKTSCMSCEARKAALNALTQLTEKHGKPEAKKIVMGLIVKSFKSPPEVVLKELREALQ